jgi:hypothetical protein
MGGNKIENLSIILEATRVFMSQFIMKAYVGNTPPNHRLIMMGHCQNPFFWPCPNNIIFKLNLVMETIYWFLQLHGIKFWSLSKKSYGSFAMLYSYLDKFLVLDTKGLRDNYSTLP